MEYYPVSILYYHICEVLSYSILKTANQLKCVKSNMTVLFYLFTLFMPEAKYTS